MISLADCIAMCGLDEDQVLAIAEHEHVPEIVAAGLAQYMLRSSQGSVAIRNMIIDDIRRAQQRVDKPHVQHLLHVLHHYLRDHPEARPPKR